jgi:DNA replication initiation complex subunit (GINS family)
MSGPTEIGKNKPIATDQDYLNVVKEIQKLQAEKSQAENEQDLANKKLNEVTLRKNRITSDLDNLVAKLKLMAQTGKAL